jgi:hypothetical protein
LSSTLSNVWSPLQDAPDSRLPAGHRVAHLSHARSADTLQGLALKKPGWHAVEHEVQPVSSVVLHGRVRYVPGVVPVQAVQMRQVLLEP